MASTVWKGHVTFGLVSFPVKLYTAARSETISFNQLHKEDHSRVKQVLYCQAEDKPITRADIVKGYEYARDKYIEIDPDELKSLRLPTATTMQIEQFVKADELPESLFDRPYFVAPKDDTQAKALTVIREALEQTAALGIGEIAFSGREHLVAIGAPPDPKQKGLMLYMLRYAEELRDPKSVLSGVKETSVNAQELNLAKQLIHASTSKFDLSAYKDDYEAAVLKLVTAKRKGKPFPEPEPAQPRAKVVNIMDALRKSLAAADHPAKEKKSAKRKTAA